MLMWTSAFYKAHNNKTQKEFDGINHISNYCSHNIILILFQEVWPSESAAVWSEVSQYIMRQDWEKASEAKKAVEEKQRKLLRERESAGETWVSKHFSVSCIGESGWDCSPIKKVVPPAPIVAPL